MKKKLDINLLITTVICLLPILLALILYDRLPDQIAVHFDVSGNPDNYFPKALAAFGLPVLFAAINIYTHFRLNNEPKRQNMSSALKLFSKWTVPVISIIMIPITLFMAIGAKINIVMISTAVVGVIIIICGNYLPKCKQNYTIGIKLPWTLDNEENWNKTHRFSGFVWVLGGIAFIISAFFSFMYAQLVIIALLVFTPFVYSYLMYREELSNENKQN